MNRPTPYIALYRWHTLAMSGRRPAVFEGEPECGWYRRRMLQGGPWVPARIWMHQDVDPLTGELADDEMYFCEVAGEPRCPFTQWLMLSSNPISEDAYHDLLNRIETDDLHRAYMAKVDLTKEPMRP